MQSIDVHRKGEISIFQIRNKRRVTENISKVNGTRFVKEKGRIMEEKGKKEGKKRNKIE